jgi:acylphosphatase
VNSRTVPEAARRIRVRGRVQGVYFRASAAERAMALSLCGCALNLRDGSVLVLAGGSADALAKLVAWLQTGPPMARVDAVDVEDIDPAAHEWPAGFQQK